jgi:proteasome assembly chaperone (PAC2) family protein
VDHLRWDRRPQLRAPVLIAAFEGWNDAGDAASTAARYLADAWSAEPFASIDPEEFYDFSTTRPQVRLVEGFTRQIDWPANALSSAAVPGRDRDVVFLQGVEPQLKWRTFCSEITGMARDLGVELVVSLGALLADVPHTRAVRVTGTAADNELVQRLNLTRSRYEGPTGIVGVLHDAFRGMSIPSASLWAAVPHYVAGTPSPKATLALVQRAADLLGASVEATDLEIASAAYERQVTDVVEGDEDIADYVRRLEEAADSGEDDEAELPSGDALAAEVERFLRDHPRD